MKGMSKLLLLGLVTGLILTGCQQKAKVASTKQNEPTCCGAVMVLEGYFVEVQCPSDKSTAHVSAKCPSCGKMMKPDGSDAMKCPACGKTVKMQAKCRTCGTMMKPTGETQEMHRCTTCGKISITGGSIDTPG